MELDTNKSIITLFNSFLINNIYGYINDINEKITRFWLAENESISRVARVQIVNCARC